jgi:peptidyl-prolyl cis-trans isomerase SurA
MIRMPRGRAKVAQLACKEPEGALGAPIALMLMLKRLKSKRREAAAGFGLLLLCTLAAIPPVTASETIDRIVAVVNEDIITLYDINRRLKPYEENVKQLNYSPDKERATLFQVRQELLNDLVDRKLTEQEVKKNNITVSEEEIDNTIERIKQSRYLTDEQLRESLSEQGFTLEEYRDEIKTQILRTKLLNREVKSKIVITSEDIQAYYDRHREKYAGDKQYHLWNLFLRLAPGADSRDREAARQKMAAVLERLNSGESFQQLAVDPPAEAGAPQGGDLGLFRINELSTQLQEVVKQLEKGEHSGLLETDFGYQIVYVERIVETEAKSLASVEGEIHDLLYREALDNRFQTWLDDLRDRSHIKIIN